MSTRLRRVSLLAGLGAVLPSVALAQQDHDGPHPPSGGDGPPRVAVSATAVDPKRVGVLVGERVEWVNASIRQHTITAREGQFDSPRLRPGQRFSHPFAAAGSFAYYCRIHPNITGIVDVANVLLHASAGRLVRGDAVALAGRVRPGTGPVTIERDPGDGFAPVAEAVPTAGGSFAARVVADASATYRAVAGVEVSAPLRVEVVPARRLAVSAERGKQRQVVHVAVGPRLPGGTVHLQRRLKERFGWWTTHRARLTRGSRATFALPRGSKARVRVVLTQPDGETRVATSRIVTLPG